MTATRTRLGRSSRKRTTIDRRANGPLETIAGRELRRLVIAPRDASAAEAENGEGEEVDPSPPFAPPPPLVSCDAPPPPPGAVSGRGAVAEGVPGALVGGLDVVGVAGVVVPGIVAVTVGVATVALGVLTVTGGTATVVTGGTLTVAGGVVTVAGGVVTVAGGVVTVAGGVVTVTGSVGVVTEGVGVVTGKVAVTVGNAVVIGRVGTCAEDSSATAAPESSPRPARRAVAAKYLTVAIYSGTVKTNTLRAGTKSQQERSVHAGAFLLSPHKKGERRLRGALRGAQLDSPVSAGVVSGAPSSIPKGVEPMRALDCVHEAHDDVHFTGQTDDDLITQVQQHRDEFHPEMTDDDVRTVVAQGAYDE